MNLLVDLDGTIIQWDWETLIQEYFGILNILPEMLEQFSLEDSLGLNDGEVQGLVKYALAQPPVFLPGSIQTLEDWKREGHEVVIYTNREKYWDNGELRVWLDGWGVPYTDTHPPIRYKFYKHGAYRYHIDDRPEKLVNMGYDTKFKLLFNQPWNRNCKDIFQRLIRVSSWKEIRKLVDETK